MFMETIVEFLLRDAKSCLESHPANGAYLTCELLSDQASTRLMGIAVFVKTQAFDMTMCCYSLRLGGAFYFFNLHDCVLLPNILDWQPYHQTITQSPIAASAHSLE